MARPGFSQGVLEGEPPAGVPSLRYCPLQVEHGAVPRGARLERPQQGLPGLYRKGRLISPAGAEVLLATTSSRDMPRLRNLDMVVGRSTTGALTLALCRSVEMVSGQKPCSAQARATR